MREDRERTEASTSSTGSQRTSEDPIQNAHCIWIPESIPYCRVFVMSTEYLVNICWVIIAWSDIRSPNGICMVRHRIEKWNLLDQIWG